MGEERGLPLAAGFSPLLADVTLACSQCSCVCGRAPQAFPRSDDTFYKVVVVGSTTELLEWRATLETRASVGKNANGKKKKNKKNKQVRPCPMSLPLPTHTLYPPQTLYPPHRSVQPARRLPLLLLPQRTHASAPCAMST